MLHVSGSERSGAASKTRDESIEVDILYNALLKHRFLLFIEILEDRAETEDADAEQIWRIALDVNSWSIFLTQDSIKLALMA